MLATMNVLKTLIGTKNICVSNVVILGAILVISWATQGYAFNNRLFHNNHHRLACPRPRTHRLHHHSSLPDNSQCQFLISKSSC